MSKICMTLFAIVFATSAAATGETATFDKNEALSPEMIAKIKAAYMEHLSESRG